MATNKKPSTAAASIESSSTKLRRLPCAPVVQNFHLVWLDESIDEVNNDYCRNAIAKLRQIISTVNTFADADTCIDLITDHNEENTFMVVSETFSQIIAPVVQDIPQVRSVYVFCENEIPCEIAANEWPKVKGIFADVTSICEVLKKATHDCDHNSVSLSFIKTTDVVSKENLDTLDQSFMYTQILKEIILTINFEQEHINKFFTYCRERFDDNTTALEHVAKLENEYTRHEPIWWYTNEYILYSMLNRALRTMEVELIINMGFFLRDLHNQVAGLHAEQYSGQNHANSLKVYRGQDLSQTDFDQLKKTEGGLLSFNNFLSTSLNRAVSLAFAESNQYNADLIGVLFEITTNRSISSSSFANVQNVSHFEEEEEILFSMHSVFRIGKVTQIDGNNRLWQVKLTLTGDSDPQLHALTESMREETTGSTGWDRLGQLMIKIGQSNKAEELYEILLTQASEESEKAHRNHMLGVVMNNQGKYAEAARFFESSIKTMQRTIPSNHPDLVNSYGNIGSVYSNLGEYSKALSYYEKALGIRQKTLTANHPDMASSYNNIGLVYKDMGEYSKALSYYEKALKMYQKTLSANHPSMATSYSNIGGVYYNMGKYSKALSYYEQALKIRQKTLPPNHPDLATSYNNIGFGYDNMGEHAKALSYYEKALEIQQKTLPANHPDLATSYNNIGLVYKSMGEYSKALSYYENDIEICRKTLPANHPDLATSYNNLGMVYDKTGEYSKALSYYEKAVEIRQKTLPANHPDFAQSYNNMGSVYDNMGEHSKALSYYEKAMKIYQKTLPVYHPRLAISYNNIGNVYCYMGDCSKALLYYDRALNILQRSLPVGHPDIKVVRASIDIVKQKL